MRWEAFVDADEVKRAIGLLCEPGQVFEIRILGTAKKDIISGYFKDADTFLHALDTIDLRRKNVYITLGELKEECFSRAQSEHFIAGSAATSDPDVLRYRWLFVDLDPVRMTGISSSEIELGYAEKLSLKVADYLHAIGFKEPVKALSGNGYHLLYRIDLPVTPETHAMVAKCLKVLSNIFSSDKVSIDTTNSNPSRVCKLHGTLAQKGTSTATRPHRMSKILSVPDAVEITDEETLKMLAGELPDEPPEDRYRRGGGTSTQEFDLLGFMSAHGMTYELDSNDRAKIYRLDHCPFNASHQDGDARIFQYSNGAIAFKCHHNSCRSKRWQDVRILYEPDAYTKHEEDDARIDAGYREHVRKKSEEAAAQSMIPQKPEKPPKERKIRKLKKAKGLMEKDLPEPMVFVGVGDELPILMEGTCILSAKPKLGKSWFSLGIGVAVAKGEDFLGYKTRQCSVLYLDLETSEVLQKKRLKRALGSLEDDDADIDVPDNFYIDTETDSLENGFVEQIEAYLKEDPKIGLVIIDVFQIIRSAAKNTKETEYEHAYRDITPLNELAQKHHIAIILVCHDRKAVDPDDPFSNILGSTGLQGAATQMIVMYRRRKNDPIHISVKGKTIDGLPELDVKLENGRWSLTDPIDSDALDKASANEEYINSDIRRAVVEIVAHEEGWRGRCSELTNKALQYNIPIIEEPKEIGRFIHKHQARFMIVDNIKVQIVDKGTASKIYEFLGTTISTISTISPDGGSPFLNDDKPSSYAGSET